MITHKSISCFMSSEYVHDSLSDVHHLDSWTFTSQVTYTFVTDQGRHWDDTVVSCSLICQQKDIQIYIGEIKTGKKV